MSRRARRSGEGRLTRCSSDGRPGPDGREHGAAPDARRPRVRRLRRERRRGDALGRRRRRRGSARWRTSSQKLAKPRAVWVMVPAAHHRTHRRRGRRGAGAGDTIIDGGNTYYRDDIAGPRRSREGHPLRRRRHERRRLRARARLLPDDRRRATSRSSISTRSSDARPRRRRRRAARPAATTAARPAEQGYLHCGPAGAGHFVKMVHNGIEYGLMAAYAEGLNILQHGRRRQARHRVRRRDRAAARPGALPVRLRHRRGRRGLAARQRGRLVAARPDRRRAGGAPGARGLRAAGVGLRRGRWTIKAAIDEGVPANVLSAALFERFGSRGEADFGRQAALCDAQGVRRARRAARPPGGG